MYTKRNHFRPGSYQFRRMHTDHIDSLGFPYDLDSMMHYSSRAFGNGKGLFFFKNSYTLSWKKCGGKVTKIEGVAKFFPD